MAEEVITLRKFRDQYLLPNESGRRFVSLYYKHSPALAEYISDNEEAKTVVRLGLKPLIWLSELLMEE